MGAEDAGLECGGTLAYTKLVSAKTTSGPKLSAQERRAAIVDAAITLFSEKGFRGTTTRELAAAVGVSEPVLYQHFATKKDLYAAIIEAKSNDVEKFVAEMSRLGQSNDDEAFFRQLADTMLTFHALNPAYLRLLLFSGLERHELSDLFHERHACAVDQLISGYIARRMESGAFRRMNPNFAAKCFMGSVAHYGMERMLHPHSQPLGGQDEVIESMVNIFMKGIRNETV